MEELVKTEVSLCYHCGDPCPSSAVAFDDKQFCCEGCKLVYELLEDNDLCTYYDLDSKPGISLKGKNFDGRYAFLDKEIVQQQLLDYSSETLCKINFIIPSIHCTSCIWLLENLYKLHKGISVSRVNFVKKTIAINFDPRLVSLRQLVELLATLGYSPDISLERYEKKERKRTGDNILIKIGVVGFCSGNIMALSFPEYFGVMDSVDTYFGPYFIWLNVLLSLPVFFYGASGYLTSAYRSLRQKVINLDVPISIGITALFARSMFEVISGTGPGYWDSLAGLVFFLLIGKWLQNKTFENLSFERNYKSYFPLATTRIKEGKHENVLTSELAEGDQILIRNQELIPADSILLSEEAWIDYSFVTGESEPIAKKAGDYIYAGGRQVGKSIEAQVKKMVSQSYLTQLWNDEAFTKDTPMPVTRLNADFSRYFTFITLAVAALAGLFWLIKDPSISLNAFTAVLIVACPCALSLSMPFAMENTMRIFGRNGFYVKHTDIIQHLATITHIVFDKTGTLTQGKEAIINFSGSPLSEEERAMVKSITAHSTHPLSQKLYAAFSSLPMYGVEQFEETVGKGLQAKICNNTIKLGSREFVEAPSMSNSMASGMRVSLSIDGIYKGDFTIEAPYRKGLNATIDRLRKTFSLSLLSGDRPTDLPVLKPLFGDEELMHFEQSPSDKLRYIKTLQNKGEKVLMIGDGLNDAGALKQSNVGMVLSEDVQSFFPACDVLADAKQFSRIDDIVRFSKTSVNIVKVSFLVSMIYNFIGISWAVSGQLSPVFAAILMPVSSISVVGFAVGMSSLYARWRKL